MLALFDSFVQGIEEVCPSDFFDFLCTLFNTASYSNIGKFYQTLMETLSYILKMKKGFSCNMGVQKFFIYKKQDFQNKELQYKLQKVHSWAIPD
jgi:hypothetical protein